MPDLGISMDFLHLAQICHRIKFHIPQSPVFPAFLRNLYQVFFLDKYLRLLELFLGLFCLEFKYAAVKCIDHICFFVFVITLVFSSI